MENLELKKFDSNRNAILVDASGQGPTVFVSAEVLKKAFITRAWLDRTLINCAVGKCLLGAEVISQGNQLKATSVWLSLEQNTPGETFKNFGLELNKPPKGPAFKDLTNGEKVAGKLSKRFFEIENPDKTKSSPDLCNFRFDNVFLENLSKRHLKNAEILTASNLIQLDLTPDWRLVTGMGEASVYETNMTLHHVYGIPYIPASSIKGVLRHFLKELNVSDSTIKLIFGDNDEKSNSITRGSCIFFDAFPLKAPRIELDVMTPHYPDYYGGDKPPADWQSPTPIHFLTVGKGTPFRFMVGLPNSDSNLELKSDMVKWLKDALTTRGVGAKTAVGYGLLKQM